MSPDDRSHVLVEYQHKHGTDFILCDTWETAGKAAESLVALNRDDWAIDKDLTDEDCIDCWGDLTDWNEFINLHDMRLRTMKEYSYPTNTPSNL